MSRPLLQWTLVFCLWLGLLGLAFADMALLGDSFWSVAAGRHLAERGFAPSADPYSFSSSGSWVVHMPFSMLAFHGVESQLGLLGLMLFGALLSSGAATISWLKHARTFEARLLCWPLWMFWIFLQREDLCVRGQLFGDLAQAVQFFLLLAMWDRAGVESRSVLRRGLEAVCFGVFGFLWLGLHASFLLGVAFPLAFAVASVIRFHSARSAANYLWMSLGMLIGGLWVPPGPALLSDILRLWQSESTRRIDLFQPPDFSSPPVALTLAFSFVVLLGTWRRLGCFRSLETALLVPLLPLLALAISGRRYLPILLAYGIILVSRALSASSRTKVTPGGVGRALGYGVAAALGLAVSAYGFGQEKDVFRDAPLEFAQEVESLGLPDRLGNAYHLGGFLTYYFSGRRRVFIDGRNQLFDHGPFDDAGALNLGLRHKELLRKYGIRTLIWESHGPLDQVLSRDPAWIAVRRDHRFVLYTRVAEGGP